MMHLHFMKHALKGLANELRIGVRDHQGGFPISSQLAQPIHDLLLTPPRNEYISTKWSVIVSGEQSKFYGPDRFHDRTNRKATMIGCYPEDDESSLILQKAFQEASIFSFEFCNMDSSNERQHRMLQAVFAKPAAETIIGTLSNAISRNPNSGNLFHSVTSSNESFLERLEFEDCMLLQNDIPMINQWLHGHPNIRYVVLCHWNSNSDVGSASQFLVQSFQDVPHQVKEVELISSQLDHIDGLSQWPSLQMLSIDCKKIDSKVGGSLATFTSLKKLALLHFSIDMDGIGLIELLQDSSCMLRDLTIKHCSSSIVPIIHCLGENSSLTHLDICGTEIGEDGLEGLIAAIELLCSLKTLAVSPSLFVVEDAEYPRRRKLNDTAIKRIVHALQHQNDCLEYLYVLKSLLNNDEHLESKFAPFTTINWAGRRLLSGDHAVPVGLWPFVLRRVIKQRYDLDTKWMFGFGGEDEDFFGSNALFYMIRCILLELESQGRKRKMNDAVV